MIIPITSQIIGVSGVTQTRLYHFEVDTIAELPPPNYYSADNVVISMASTAHVIEDNSDHEMKSDGTWIQQTAGTSTYTRAEIDTMQAAQAANNAAQQSEIDYAINTGAKNYCPYDSFSAAGAGTVISDQPINLPAGDYILTLNFTATTGSSAFRFLDSGASIINFNVQNSSAGTASVPFTLPSDANQIRVYTTTANDVTDIMIRPAAVTDSSFVPYCPTLYELYQMVLAL